MAWQFGIRYVRDKTTNETIPAECTVMRPLQNAFEMSTIVFFVVPMLIIIILYLLIGIQLRRSESISRSE